MRLANRHRAIADITQYHGFEAAGDDDIALHIRFWRFEHFNRICRDDVVQLSDRPFLRFNKHLRIGVGSDQRELGEIGAADNVACAFTFHRKGHDVAVGIRNDQFDVFAVAQVAEAPDDFHEVVRRCTVVGII